jgi:hypothetical protein
VTAMSSLPREAATLPAKKKNCGVPWSAAGKKAMPMYPPRSVIRAERVVAVERDSLADSVRSRDSNTSEGECSRHHNVSDLDLLPSAHFLFEESPETNRM